MSQKLRFRYYSDREVSVSALPFWDLETFVLGHDLEEEIPNASFNVVRPHECRPDVIDMHGSNVEQYLSYERTGKHLCLVHSFRGMLRSKNKFPGRSAMVILFRTVRHHRSSPIRGTEQNNMLYGGREQIGLTKTS